MNQAGAEESTTNSQHPLIKHSHWLLRFVIASIFIYYGIDKFMGGGIKEFAGAMQLPTFIAALAALAEIGAGVLVVVGASAGSKVTRLGALLVFPIMLGAIFMVHWGQWHMMPTQTHPMGGMGFQVSLLLVATYIFIRGNDI